MKKSLLFTILLALGGYCIGQSTSISNNSYDEVIIPSALELKKPFVIKNLDLFPDNELFIFDKQGNLIFHTEYYRNSWDGKKENGKEVAEDEMCYYILDDGRGTVHTGYLLVVK
jgi:hypothetical protein